MTPFQRRCIAIALAIGAMFFVTGLELFVQRHHHLLGGGINKTFLLALINLHIVIIALLLFFIVRNSIKLYYERSKRVPGSVFKRNLLFAFVLFSVTPSFFVFFTAGKFITQSIDRWFTVRFGQGMEQALQLHEQHTRNIRDALMKRAQGQEVHFIWDKNGRALHGHSLQDEIKIWRTFRECNDQSMKSLKQKFLVRLKEASSIVLFDFYGSLYAVVPMGDQRGVLVHRYPSPVRQSLMRVQSAFDDYEQLKSVRNAIHVNYFLTFLLVTLLIIFLSIWCAFYLARGMSKPIQTLLKATDEIRQGHWDVHVPVDLSSDLQSLAHGFNEMAAAVKKAHAQLQQKNKERVAHATIKTWQEAAKQMAHEIKNPLTPIQLATQRLQRKYKTELSDDRIFADCTNTILQQVDVIKYLVNHFSQFASMPSPYIQDVDMRVVVREVVCLYELGYPEIIFIEKFDNDLGVIKTDREKIKLSLVNLVDNAVRALMKQKNNGDGLRVSINVFVDEWINITVADNGPGIPQEVQDTLFQPYVSTEKKNMGLGLAIVRDSITQLGGSIDLVGTMHGTMFHIRLPVAH